MKIGNIQLDNNIFLAPMAGITDLPFRLLCKEYGAGLVCTEMISSKALMYGDEKTKQLLVSKKEEKPLMVQIFGSDVQAIGYAVKYLSKIADIIDINMGCPAPKVVKNGDGSKLLLDLDLVKQITEAAVKVSKVPITVKMRTGWDSTSIVAVEAAKIIERAGASAITVHGRTRSQFYSGKADWDIIKEVKQAVKIPVIGNGDIKCAEDVEKMLEQTKVDGVMIGRATLGNPWIFREVNEYLKYGKVKTKVTLEERLETIIKHLELELEQKSEITAVREMRKHIAGYTKNLKDSSVLRNTINHLDKKEDVINCLKEYFERIK